MNVIFPDNTPVISILEVAAKMNCEVRSIGGGTLKIQPVSKPESNVRVLRRRPTFDGGHGPRAV